MGFRSCHGVSQLKGAVVLRHLPVWEHHLGPRFPGTALRSVTHVPFASTLRTHGPNKLPSHAASPTRLWLEAACTARNTLEPGSHMSLCAAAPPVVRRRGSI